MNMQCVRGGSVCVIAPLFGRARLVIRASPIALVWFATGDPALDLVRPPLSCPPALLIFLIARPEVKCSNHSASTAFSVFLALS